MKKGFWALIFAFTGLTSVTTAQDSTGVHRVNVVDTVVAQDQIYNRPFIGYGQSRTAVGGYLEGNTNYFAEDGVSDGFSMELRRFNIFLYSGISKRIKFLSELEFEHGTEEIALETALIDFEFNSAFNFRGGIILPQIGLFNANHDSPKWDIIDRPLSSTTIIPSTLSEVGFGFFGKLYPGNNIVSYDVYMTNGLQDGIVLNEESKTFIPFGKSEEMFAEDNNGTPMFNARVAFINRKIGEFGLSYYGGVYNTFALEGVEVEEKRSVHLYAFDFTANLGKGKLQGEYVFANIDVAEGISEIFGTQQHGGFAEVIWPIVTKEMFGYEKAKINAITRFELVDYNYGSFAYNGESIGDEITALSVGISFRPNNSTSFRANYRRHWTTDILGNVPALLGGFQFGFATYF
jgi:hypothetical protein